MNNEILFYKTPAEKYINALPLGNGRMGAMVCGGIAREKINLNEDTLWSGFPRSNWMYNTYERFTKRLRKKILEEEDLVGAEDFASGREESYFCRMLPGRTISYNVIVILYTSVETAEGYTAKGRNHNEKTHHQYSDGSCDGPQPAPRRGAGRRPALHRRENQRLVLQRCEERL